MEYVARQERRSGESIFLEVDRPGMANSNNIGFHSIEEAREMIDFEKYEILIPRMIPLDLIRNLPGG